MHVLCWDGAVVAKVQQQSVSMIGRQVVFGEEVGAQYSLPDVGDGKIEGECLIAESKSAIYLSVAWDRRSVCCGKLGPVGTALTLLCCWGNYGADCSRIHQPFLSSTLVCDVKEKTVLPSNRVHVRVLLG